MSSLQKTTKSICQPDGHPGQRRARVRLTPVGADDAASDSATGLLQAIRRLFAHLSPRRRRQGIGILLFMLLGAIAEMITIGAVLPFLTVLAAPDRVSSYPLFGRVLNRLGIDSWHLLTVATIVFVGTAVIAAVIRLALLRTSQKYVFRMGYELSVKMYDTMLHQEYSYHVASNSSAVLAGIQKCTTVTSQFLQPALQNIISITVAIFIIAALTYADPIIALISLMSFGGIYLLVSIPARRILRRNGTVAAAAQTVRIKAIQEGMGGIRDVLLDRAQPMYVRTFATHDSDFRDAQAVNSFISLAPRFVVESAGMVAIALLAVVFSRSEGGLYAALPMLGALAIGAQKLLPLLQQVYSGWAQMTSSYAILDDVLAFLDQPRKKAATGLEVLPFAHSIELDRIRFAYQPQMPDVLDGVTLSIPKGATVGFIGKTGSGKSTIIDIVMGLLSPREGGMRVDGVPIEGDERLALANEHRACPAGNLLGRRDDRREYRVRHRCCRDRYGPRAGRRAQGAHRGACRDPPACLPNRHRGTRDPPVRRSTATDRYRSRAVQARVGPGARRSDERARPSHRTQRDGRDQQPRRRFDDHHRRSSAQYPQQLFHHLST